MGWSAHLSRRKQYFFKQFAISIVFFLTVYKLCWLLSFSFCNNIKEILAIDGMLRLCSSGDFVNRTLKVQNFMSDNCIVHKTFVAKEFPNSRRLKYFQHMGRNNFFVFLCVLLILMGIFYRNFVWSADIKWNLLGHRWRLTSKFFFNV